MYTVYIHVNMVNLKRYVGITSQNPKRRWDYGRGYSNQVFGKAIEKYGWDNFNHIIAFEGLSLTDAENLEEYLIYAFKSNDPRYGYNIQSGGFAHRNFSPDSIEKMRLAKKGICGEKHNRWGSKHSEETKKFLSEFRKTQTKKYNQYSLDGEFIKTWNSRKEIGEYFKKSPTSVTYCCQGKCKSAFGFIWKYA